MSVDEALEGVVVRREGEPMHAVIASLINSPGSPVNTAIELASGSLPRPPGRPPAEPIVVKIPPRRRDDPEVEGPDDEDEGGLRWPPAWLPDLPPPPPPEERARRSATSRSRPC